jgi:hypothetical protein
MLFAMNMDLYCDDPMLFAFNMDLYLLYSFLSHYVLKTSIQVVLSII